jgi:hypothetical protein
MTMRIACLLVPAPLVVLLVLSVAGHVGGGVGDKDKVPVFDKDKDIKFGFKKGGKGDKDKAAKPDKGDKVAPPVVPATPIPPGLVEVRFTNGSIVVMTMLQDKVEVVTDYGTLLVPPRDIRNIDFGLHLTDEEKRKLEDLVDKLGSSAHDEREKASQDLAAMGPLAFLRLHSAVKSQDLEVSRRAEAALKAIREKHAARFLRLREDDTIRTNKFSIVGRIVTPTFKAKAEDFGELDLRPGRLLAIRWLAADTKKEVVVDAPTYGAPGNAKWMGTGIRLESHVGVKFSASGQVDLLPQQPGQRVVGPDGGGNGNGMMAFGGKGARFFNPNVGQPGGELMGKIGETGQPFFIGSRHSLSPKTAGQLFLMIAQSPWGCPTTGEYRVTVSSGAVLDDEEGDD